MRKANSGSQPIWYNQWYHSLAIFWDIVIDFFFKRLISRNVSLLGIVPLNLWTPAQWCLREQWQWVIQISFYCPNHLFPLLVRSDLLKAPMTADPAPRPVGPGHPSTNTASSEPHQAMGPKHQPCSPTAQGSKSILKEKERKGSTAEF